MTPAWIEPATFQFVAQHLNHCGKEANKQILKTKNREREEIMLCRLIFVNNQLHAQFFFIYVYFYSLHVSDSYVPIIRSINCINTTSGTCHSENKLIV